MKCGRAGRLLGTLALVWLAASAFAGEPRDFTRLGARYRIDRWETDDGLPQNSVIALTQTRDGYLWLGTLNGLVRFDGLQFTVFDERDTPGLPSRRVVLLFEDRRGDLWVGTETAGAALIRGGRVTPVDLGRGSREGRLVSAAEDGEGAVWLYTADGQLCRYREGRVDVWRVATEQLSALRLLAAPSAGPMLVATDWRLLKLKRGGEADPTSLPVEEMEAVPKLDFLLASRSAGHWRLAGGRVQKWSAEGIQRDLGPYPWGRTIVTSACEDAEGNLVVGTLGQGVYWFDAEGAAVQLSREQGLSHNYILSLMLDREGSLWIGTDGGGLNRVKRLVFDVLEASLGQVVQSVSEDTEGGLWVGYSGGWVERWQGAERRRYEPGRVLGLPELSVRSVAGGRRGMAWVGTWGAGVVSVEGEKVERTVGLEGLNPLVQALLFDRGGRLWVGTRNGLGRWDGSSLRVFGTGDGLASGDVLAMVEGAGGEVWVGTAGGGLSRIRDDRLESFRLTGGSSTEAVSCLWADPRGVVWAGTGAGRLSRFDGREWSHYLLGQGLEDSAPGYLMGDPGGGLWIGAGTGLMRVGVEGLAEGNRAGGRLTGRLYGRTDGLPTRECAVGSQPATWRGADGRIRFATIKGLASVRPAEMRTNPHPPPVVIESVLVEGQPVLTNRLVAGAPERLILPAGRQRLEIHYTSLNLAAPDRAVFRYRLAGHETDWTEAGNTRVARYSRLPPGHYQFLVRAGNEDGVWNEAGSGFALVVLPPFWRTWWFLGCVALGAVTTVAGTVYYLSTQKLQRQLAAMRQQQALERERTRIARDIHDQVGANLTQVSMLGELVESDRDFPEEVASHARQITQTARDTTKVLDEIVWAVNPSNDTLEGLISYFCKNAQEYLSLAGLRYRLDVPAGLPATPIPPDLRHNVFLAAKEAVTNIVRHARATEARIRLRLEADRFVLEVEDNGRGMGHLDPEAAKLRNGLTNMRRRLEDVGGTCSMLPGPKGGTLVRLVAPLRSVGLDASRETA